jgi:hypothetical protein
VPRSPSGHSKGHRSKVPRLPRPGGRKVPFPRSDGNPRVQAACTPTATAAPVLATMATKATPPHPGRVPMSQHLQEENALKVSNLCLAHLLAIPEGRAQGQGLHQQPGRGAKLLSGPSWGSAGSVRDALSSALSATAGKPALLAPACAAGAAASTDVAGTPLLPTARAAGVGVTFGQHCACRDACHAGGHLPAC